MTGIFSKDFLENLPQDSVSAGLSICEAVLSYNRMRLQKNGNSSAVDDQDAYLDALALFEVYIESHALNIKYELPTLVKNAEANSKSIIEFFKAVRMRLHESRTKERLSNYRAKYAELINPSVVYRFEPIERDRVRKILHELRVLIDDMDTVTGDQKLRLMHRLGQIHADIDSKLTTLDHLWGLLGEAFVVKAKHGESGRMIVERLYQIVNIVWQVQARAESVDPGCLTPTPPLK